MRVVAEWNIRQREIASAHRRPRRGQAAPPPSRTRRPQDPRTAIARLAKAQQAVDVSDAGAAFWFGQGLVNVS